uniref:Uncharacterized protein n=1 Tax=viral metagenome TaxID=1070528 RepID=A0A6C0HZL8_9ZZZZ
MSGFERKILENGQINAKYIDLCDEDQPIAGQKFACLSFISPEKILKNRQLWIFEQFVKQWDFKKSMDKFFDFLQFASYKYGLEIETLMNDYTEFIKEEGPKLKDTGVEDDYNNFLDKNEDDLTQKFQKENHFQTSVRGLKIRGVFPTQEEAELRCKKIRDSDPNHDILVGPVGIWLPWDPDAYKTGRIEFMEDELNQLHHEKVKNEEKAKEEFEKRVKETKRKAIEENIKLANKTGNVLTQTIDEEGNLIGVRETVDFESREVATEEETKAYNDSILSGSSEK